MMVSSLLVFAASWVVTTPEAQAAYTTDDGQLREVLVIRDSQKGFGLEKGKILTVGPDGVWTFRRYSRRTNEEEVPEGETRSGKLPRPSLEKLAEVLRTNALAGLPAQVGRDPKINQHTVIMTFGSDLTRSLILEGNRDAATSQPPDNEPQKEEWRRFTAILKAVHGITKHEDR